MTATERLRELLSERGVEWESDGSGFRVMWGQPVPIDQMQFKAVDNALPNGGLNISICGFSPEQAIAATLGERSNTNQNGVTAEQVREAAHGHYELRMVRDMDGLDVPQVVFDWQAIADELNALSLNNPSMSETLSERGTCHDSNKRFNAWQCSKCGATLLLSDDYCEPTLNIDGVASTPNYCPNCGRKVEE